MRTTRKTESNIAFTTSKGNNPKRPYTKEDCDILALVCLPERKIQFLPVGMCRGVTKKIHMDTFINDPDITARSWKFALDKSIEETRLYLESMENRKFIANLYKYQEKSRIKINKKLFDIILNLRHNN